MVTNYGLPRAQTTLPVTVSPLPYGVSITPDQAPTASFVTSINGSTVFFDGSASSSPVGSIATYKWNFGDGTVTVTTTIPTTSHTYDEGGIFTASLTVTNTAGTSTTTVFTGQMVTNYGLPRAQATLPVTISPLPYGVSITPDQAPTAAFTTSINGSTVFFDGSGSSSPVGSIATYKWNFGDGTLPVTTTIPTTSHTYDEGGIFTVSLTVTNTAGTSTTTVFTGQMVTNYGLPRAQTTLPVTVSPLPYGVSITPDQAPTAAFTTSINGSTVFFDGSFSSSPVGSIASYAWNFGDGTANTTTIPTISHIYGRGGSFTASLTVTNTAGTSTTTVFTGQMVTNYGQPRATVTHSVSPPPSPYGISITPDQGPTASFITFINGLTVFFDGSASSVACRQHRNLYMELRRRNASRHNDKPNDLPHVQRGGSFTASLTVTNSSEPQQATIFTGQMVTTMGPSSTPVLSLPSLRSLHHPRPSTDVCFTRPSTARQSSSMALALPRPSEASRPIHGTSETELLPSQRQAQRSPTPTTEVDRSQYP